METQGGRRGEREREREKDKIKRGQKRPRAADPKASGAEQQKKKRPYYYYYYYCTEIRSIGDINYIGLALLCYGLSTH